MDLTSMASTLNVISKNPAQMSIDGLVPDGSTLTQIEATVTKNFDQYIGQDLSVVVASMIKMGYTPKMILEQVNQMRKVSTFSQDQSIRMLEALVGDESDSEEIRTLKASLFTKFFDQLEKHALNLNSYNVCRAFACLESQIKLAHITSDRDALRKL